MGSETIMGTFGAICFRALIKAANHRYAKGLLVPDRETAVICARAKPEHTGTLPLT